MKQAIDEKIQGFSIKKSEALVYKLYNKERYTWAHIIIQEWPEGGSLNIQSDYGKFAYSWNSIGSGVLREFLCILEYDYFMSKAAHTRGRQFSLEKSIKYMQEEILNRRRETDISKEVAKECWDQLKNAWDMGWITNEYEFTKFIDENNDFVSHIYGGDYCDVSYAKERDPQCQAFWERIWPVICAEWKREIAAGMQ